MISFKFKTNGKSGRTTIVASTAGGQTYTLRADLSDPDSRASAVNKIHAQFPGHDRDDIADKLESEAARTTDRGETIAERLLAHVRQPERLELFHSPESEPYAFVRTSPGSDARRTTHERWPSSAAWETMHVRGQSFRLWVGRECYMCMGKVPNAETIGAVLGALEGEARFGAEERSVFVRVGQHDDLNGPEVWLDLADSETRLVRVTRDGWSIVYARAAPVRFVRKRGMLALPVPQLGGSVSELRPFLNVDDRQWILVAGFLVMTLRLRGPFPFLMLNGEQGSAKSTAGRVLRMLVDPNQADNRRPPKDPQSLAIAASNGWLLSFDNMSGIQPWLSDDLCALATGGGFGTRMLYSDGEEAIFCGARPVILNGIEDLGTRADLGDRGVHLVLRRIDDRDRREESEFWAEFDLARPRVLGALLDAVAVALAREPGIRLERKPRMADFAKWVEAAGPGLGLRPGEFLDAYNENRLGMSALALESSPFAVAVRDLVEKRGDWSGSATDLLAAVTGQGPERLDGWPKGTRKVAAELRRFAPALRAAGIEFEPGDKDTKRRTVYRLSKVSAQSFGSSGPSAQPERSAPAAAQPAKDLKDAEHSAGTSQDDLYADDERAAIQDDLA